MGIQIYADGASLDSIIELNKNPLIEGFTTNPSLMRKAGVTNYEEFAKDVLHHVRQKPVSFEVFADDFEIMETEANKIASWGDNVYVKIPVMNTRKESSYHLISRLALSGIKINVTCVFTYNQIDNAIQALRNSDGIISIFAGRIMDAGEDASKIIHYAVRTKYDSQKILWASTRELYNIQQAKNAGADIITVGHDLLGKMNLIGKDLTEFSHDTVCMFRDDGVKSGYKII